MSYFKRFCVVLNLLVMGFLATSALAQDLLEEEASLVALFGDSISTGVQFSTGFIAFNGDGRQGFGCPAILMQNLLRNEGSRLLSQGVPCPTDIISTPVRDRVEAAGDARNSFVVNWGEGGTTTPSGVARIQSNLLLSASQFPAAQQRFALIHYGTNDLGFGIGSSTTAFNIRQMINLSRAVGYVPAVSTLLPRSFADTQPLGNVIRSVGQQEGVPVVDMFSLYLNFPGSPSPVVPLRGLAGQQGGASNLLPVESLAAVGVFVTTRLHPNDQGYSVMIEAWFEEFLEDAIESARDVVIAPIINLLLDEE